MTKQAREQDWTAQDFVDQDDDAGLPDEADPWDLVPDGHPSPRRYPASDSAGFAHSDFVADALDVLAGDTQWSELGDQLYENEWDEPTPTAEAQSELSEALYPADPGITDLTVELRIGDFLMQVAPMEPNEHDQCVALLRGYSVGRLRRLIPWFRQYEWSGSTLLALLRFRRYWESERNLDWWESFRWIDGQQQWIPLYQPSALSWEAALELLKNREGRAPHKVIDPRWYTDWNRHRVWEMDIGLSSFAGFAFFRSGLLPNEPWLSMLARLDRRTTAERAECEDETFAPFMLPSIVAQYRCRAVDQARGGHTELKDLAGSHISLDAAASEPCDEHGTA